MTALSTLRRHWLVALLVTLTSMAAVAVVLTITPPTYTATSVIALSPRPEGRLSADLLRLTIPSYASIATSPSVAADLARRIDDDPDRVRDAIGVENPPSSNTLLLSVTWADPRTAAELANAVSDEVVDASRTDELISGSVAAVAVPPNEPSWPPQPVSLILGVILSVALGFGAAWLADRRRSLLSSPGDLISLVEEKGLPVPVLTVGTSLAGAAAYVVRAVGAQLGTGTPGAGRVELTDVGSASPRTVALAMAAAGALSRQGLWVHVSLREADKILVHQADVDGDLLFTGPGKVTWGFSDMPPAVVRAAKGRTVPGSPDAILRVTDSGERISNWAREKSLVGVVPVVAARTPAAQVRAVLTELRALDAPVLAVCYLLGLPKQRALQTA